MFVHVPGTEREFICCQPSCIAGAAIVAAIQGLTHTSQADMAPCIERIASMLGCTASYLHPILNALETSVKRAASGGNGDSSSSGPGDSTDGGAGFNSKLQQYSKHSAMMDQGEDITDTDGKETPVDVLDIQF